MSRSLSFSVALTVAACAGWRPLPAETMSHFALPPVVQNAPVNEGGLVPGDTVPNFRLVDHRGRAHELYYESNRNVIVLVFTDSAGPLTLRQSAALRRLRDRFPATQVTLWQIASGQRVDRASLAAEQATYAIDEIPALHDGAQLVATELGAASAGETFVLDALTWTLGYRGPLDDANPTNPLDLPRIPYAENAVVARLARTAVNPARVPLRAGTALLDLPAPPATDYATVIAPIVQKRCVACHATGGIAPRAFKRYEDLAERPGNLRQVLLEQRMPPWDADARYDAFSPNAGLSPDEAARLFAWVRAGTPRGIGADPIAANPPPAVPDWPLGTPDSILTIPTQTLPPTGKLSYRYLPVFLPQTRWLKAIVVRPGNRNVVHHALVFDGLEGLLAAGGGLGGNFAGYVPGIEPRFFPAGTGKRVTANDVLVLQMHYVTTGKAETDRTQIGLYYFPVGQTPARELQTKAAGSSSFTIPAGAPDVPIEGSFTVERNSLLYELNPHMHYRGRRVRYDAFYPDGRTELLLNVPTYSFDWQRDYRFALPKALPAGTVITVKGSWDNSVQNLSNPNPQAVVGWGEQTDDEMFIGYLTLADTQTPAGTTAPTWPGAQSGSGYVGHPIAARFLAQGADVRYRAENLPAGLALDTTTGVLAGTPTAAGRTRASLIAENAAGAAMVPLDLTLLPQPKAPIFVRQPESRRGTLGGSAIFSAEVLADPAPLYQWFKGESEFCFAEGPALALSGLTWTHAGDYRLVVSNAAGSTTSQRVFLTLDPPSLVNLSTRATLAPGQRLIAGFTLTGTVPKRVLLRAIGPTLAVFGVPDALPDPELELYDAAGRKMLLNNDQGNLPASFALARVTADSGGFALPAGSRDAALTVSLAPGNYTLHVTGRDNRGGSVLAEVYDADQGGTSVVNLSCRMALTAQAPTLITGFVVGGTEPRRVLIRAAGPALALFGVPGRLATPRLTIYGRDNTRIAQGSGWSETAELRGAFTATGAFAFAAGSADTALLLTLPAGSYTAHVDGGLGETLVEVYPVP